MFPESVPPSRIAELGGVLPTNVKTSTPPPSEIPDVTDAPEFTVTVDAPSLFRIANPILLGETGVTHVDSRQTRDEVVGVPLGADTVPLFRMMVVVPVSVYVSIATLDVAPVTFPFTLIVMLAPSSAVTSIPSEVLPSIEPLAFTTIFPLPFRCSNKP